MPIRKYLFWGLTIVLIVALANLMIRSYRLDKKKAQQMVETVEEAKPSSTRVLNPQDLKIVQSKMELQPAPGKDKESVAARHEVEIGNSGNVTYKDVQIRFVYLSAKGEQLGDKTQLIEKSVPAGTMLKLADISIGDVPASAVGLETTILCADIQPPNPAK
jgi:hypothetical protein